MENQEELIRIMRPLYENNPKYTEQSLIDRAGVGIVMTQLAKQNLYLKELTTGDVGIDGIIEPVMGDFGTGKLIACQIKSSKKKYSDTEKEYFLHNEGNLAHYDYWTKNAVPVIIILVDTENGECFWEHVTDDNITKNEKSFSIKVPSNKKLAFEEIYELSINRTLEDTKYFYLRENAHLIDFVKEYCVQVHFKDVTDGDATLEWVVTAEEDIVIDPAKIIYFKWSKGQTLDYAVEQYFFWAEIEIVGVHKYALKLNEIGETFIKVHELLKGKDLDFK